MSHHNDDTIKKSSLTGAMTASSTCNNAVIETNNDHNEKHMIINHDDNDIDNENKTKNMIPFITVNNIPIYYFEQWNTGLIGSGLWSTGLAMAQYFSSLSTSKENHAISSIRSISNNNKKLNVLELGSGNGLLSVCFAAMASSYINRLVVTDTYDHLFMMEQTLHNNSHMIQLMNQHDLDNNITDDNDKKEKNHHAYHMKNNNKVPTYIMEHMWGQFDNNNNQTSLNEQQQQLLLNLSDCCPFDIIIGSDLAYREDLYDPLIRSFDYFCSTPSPSSSSSSSSRTTNSTNKTVILLGVTMVDTKPLFFHLLNRYGYIYEKLADHLLQPEFRNPNFGIFIIQKKNR